MKTFVYGFVLSLALAGASMAQQYEVGGFAGTGFVNGLTMTNSAGSATTGLKPGPAFGGLLAHNMYTRLSGEVHYTFRSGDLRLASGGTEATFSGMTHSIHYDVLFHPQPKRGSKAMPFVAVGGGARIFSGTGKEAAYQPLNQFGYLTKTQEVKPMLSAGGGVKFRLGTNLYLRTEFRDYITPFPKQVIAPAEGSKVKGWLHDFVPMVGVSYTF